MSTTRADLARTTLAVLIIVLLMAGSVWILWPFLASLIWATMIVVATWPILLRVQGWFGGRRWPAVTVMTLLMMFIFLGPLAVAIDVIVERAGDMQAWVQALPQRTWPEAPAWVGQTPLLGSRLVAGWDELRSIGLPELSERIQPYAGAASRWLLAEATAFGLLVVQLLLVVILSAVFYSGGEDWGAWVKAFGRRVADHRGENAVVLAGQAIRGVALGVVVTAVVQAAFGGIGLAIAGVPFPLLLTAIMLFLCTAQLGPLLVLIPATIWLFVTDQTGWGTFLLIWSVVDGLMDNFIRPVLIRRGADLPLLLIIAGVVGGLLSFGLIGIFVGPVVLAVTYTLADAWVHSGPAGQQS